MKGNCLGHKSSKGTEGIFQTAKIFQYAPFGRNRPPKRGVYNGCRLRSYFRSVAHELCYLNVISKLSTIDIFALGSKYHLSCLSVLVNCTRKHNNGKATRKKEKRNCQSITLADLISHKQHSRRRQPRTTDFKLSDSRDIFWQKAWRQRNKRYTHLT